MKNKRLTDYKETKEACIDFARVKMNIPWSNSKVKKSEDKMLSEFI